MIHLAIDYGAKRLGLALSDDEGRLAFPHSTHHRSTNDANGDVDRLISLIKAFQVGRVVFGHPGGSEASDSTASAAQKFGAKLSQRALQEGLQLDFAWWDERFSTAEALKGLVSAGISQKKSRNADGSQATDARAAAVILQSFLDARNPPEPTQGAAGPDSSQ